MVREAVKEVTEQDAVEQETITDQVADAACKVATSTEKEVSDKTDDSLPSVSQDSEATTKPV